MRSSLTMLAVLVASCGGSSPPIGTASTVEPQGEPASSSELAPHAAAAARCDGGPFALSVPTSGDSELGAARQGCALVPRGMASADPNTLPWTVMFAFIPVGDSGPELELAVEPDGARRWASRLMEGATATGEGTVTILGAATSWYGLHGGLPGGREGDALVARVTIENTYLVALAMSVGDSPDLRDRYLATVAATTRP